MKSGHLCLELISSIPYVSILWLAGWVTNPSEPLFIAARCILLLRLFRVPRIAGNIQHHLRLSYPSAHIAFFLVVFFYR